MKQKTHFTRKNLIFLALLFFFFVLQTFCLACLDEALGVIKKGNPIAQFAAVFGIRPFKLNVVDYVSFFLIIFWIFIAITAVIFISRISKYYDGKLITFKTIIFDIVTLIVCFFFSVPLSIIFQFPYSLEKFVRQISILFQSFFLSSLIYIVLGSLIFGVFVLIVNFKHIDEPYRFFGKKEAAIQEEIEKLETEEALDEIEESDLTNSLDIPVDENGNPLTINGLGGGQGVGGNASINETPIGTKEVVFPSLCSIDAHYEYGVSPIESEEITLKEFCDKFRNYLASNGLYFDIRTIREFISAFSTTRLIILEGLSGTGKSSLPRYLANFLSTDAFFAPVQSTWRDRTNILGYYNDFSKKFNETDFLKRLYKANYDTENINIMVLDEMNLSRIEYYFADFLSILEFPEEEWKLHLMQLPFGFVAPNKIIDGKIQIPTNTYFIGTANKDDSTYTITDKVYDRAITLDFDDLNEPFDIDEEQGPINMSSSSLQNLLEEAMFNENNQLTEEELEKFKVIARFTYETFDLTFGNRIYNQINQFVPVFVASGGNKVEALDFLFTRKILYKIEGRFEEYVKTGLINLKALIKKEYGDSFTKSIHEIDKMLRRL